ncbi:MAG: mitochondrial small ribosomal subunit protein uS17m [Candidatus Moeniiplasma glomeromycotorum]|nr:mitochondrial small ribosomal subunit protein uS17m [Candidatus Moeniiplasma glomeromycotorum]MCE8167722.1 mitochondrial small ribosomal subunit protein uS17m [Candidatus Moeniiplasma glomeromycotorum]MCE8169122.1 mitochondrial small ribosomal subunit protein uS17m [Candidatus Moeniiplasma glomeromycotorum]
MNQTFTGTIISLKNLQTATVEIVSTHLHPKYHVPYKHKKRIRAHYEQTPLQLGDKVVIKSSRPYSKTKRFLVVERIEQSQRQH